VNSQNASSGQCPIAGDPDGIGQHYAVSREFGSCDGPNYHGFMSFDDYKLVIYQEPA
jgi:hypothetical protein